MPNRSYILNKLTSRHVLHLFTWSTSKQCSDPRFSPLKEFCHPILMQRVLRCMTCTDNSVKNTTPMDCGRIEAPYENKFFYCALRLVLRRAKNYRLFFGIFKYAAKRCGVGRTCNQYFFCTSADSTAGGVDKDQRGMQTDGLRHGHIQQGQIQTGAHFFAGSRHRTAARAAPPLQGWRAAPNRQYSVPAGPHRPPRPASVPGWNFFSGRRPVRDCRPPLFLSMV